MPAYTPHRLFVIFRVQLYARKLKSVIMAGYGYRAAAQMRVEYSVALFRIVFQQPFVERDGLLRGVNLIAGPIVEPE